MTPTDISEHARRAALAFSETGRPREKTWPMIQYGINLAVAEKDKRISELERDCKIWVDEVNEQITELQSKDREIERLTAEVIAFEFEENTSKHLLTEANANLAEAEEKLSKIEWNPKEKYGGEFKQWTIDKFIRGMEGETDAIFICKDTLQVSSFAITVWKAGDVVLHIRCKKDDRDYFYELTEENNLPSKELTIKLSSAQAEIERLKGDIIEDTSAQDAEDRREEESQRLRDLHIGRNI